VPSDGDFLSSLDAALNLPLLPSAPVSRLWNLELLFIFLPRRRLRTWTTAGGWRAGLDSARDTLPSLGLETGIRNRDGISKKQQVRSLF